jgi:ABC-type nickel/cobalt efflux system permease component RcnA
MDRPRREGAAAVGVDLAAIDPLWIGVAAAVLLVLLAVAVLIVVRRRRRRRRDAARYGAEYQRTVRRAGSRRAADRELRAREDRRRSFELRELTREERARFRGRFEALQASFVDEPMAAVRRADELLDELAEARGYPDADREQRLADLSVDHPASVDTYRRGRPRRTDDDRAPSTEQLRTALLSSRSLFEALLGRDDPSDRLIPPPRSFRDLDVRRREHAHAGGTNGHHGHGRHHDHDDERRASS